jgi:hypothetical protein
VTDPGSQIFYLAKLDGATGAAIKAKTWGGSGRTDAYSLTVDASNNILGVGSLGANIDFSGGITMNNLGMTDAFVVKVTADLTPLWAKSFGDSGYDQTAKTVAVSSSGDVYFGGSFKGELGALNLTSTTTENLDAFLGQLSGVDGSVVCGHAYGDAPGAEQLSTVTVARAATGALADWIAIGGTFSKTITLGTTTLDVGSGSNFTQNGFVSRITP